ncbi:DUF805 domain-containing protein [Myroides odoratus]|uniref:DUF805 domain-containing protein n=1 Tax=Myroides odoratus TaxID=256 RepID=UPI000765E616|nr:DUF805 domain-containing protein [Myroides odoratus]
MINLFVNPFRKVFDFDGRASRLEFWVFIVCNIFLCFLFGIFRAVFKFPEIVTIVFVFFLNLVTISLGFRRLNDAKINKLFFLIPLVNLILAGLPSKK